MERGPRGLIRSLVGALGIAVLAVACQGSPAGGPNRAELVAALRHVQTNADVSLVEVSSVDRTYASVTWTMPQDPEQPWVDLLHRSNAGWVVVYGFERGERADGACAFASSEVVRDLYGTACPGDRFVHARAAQAHERKLLRAAWRSSPITRQQEPGGGKLSHLCVSRVDSAWAAGIVSYVDTAGAVWFRRGPQSWTAAYDSMSSTGSLPGPPVVLSLASCTGYNAAMYGG